MTAQQRRLVTWLPLLIVAIPCLALGGFSVPAADDYIHAVLVEEAGGPLAYALNSYATWSGRFLTEFLTGITLGTVDYVPLLATLHACALIGIAVLLVAPARRSWPLAAAIATAALWVSVRPLLAWTVYWATGGLNYVVPVALGLAWLEFGRRSLAADLRWRALPTIAWALAGLALGTAHEQASAAVVAAGVAAVGLSVFEVRGWHWQHTFLTVGLAAFAAGALVLVVAPGNKLRAASVGQRPVLEPIAFVANYGHVVQTLLVFLLLSIGFGLAAASCSVSSAKPTRAPGHSTASLFLRAHSPPSCH
jgi:hypothetical protein